LVSVALVSVVFAAPALLSAGVADSGDVTFAPAFGGMGSSAAREIRAADRDRQRKSAHVPETRWRERRRIEVGMGPPEEMSARYPERLLAALGIRHLRM
jgi:hypothetical protein